MMGIDELTKDGAMMSMATARDRHYHTRTCSTGGTALYGSSDCSLPILPTRCRASFAQAECKGSLRSPCHQRLPMYFVHHHFRVQKGDVSHAIKQTSYNKSSFPYPFIILLSLLSLLSACANNSNGITSSTPANNTITGRSNQVLTASVLAIGSFEEYALPQTGSGLMRPAIDRRGRLWFGEMSRNYLAMFDPHTRQFEQMKPPHGAFGIMGIAVAADDTIWFAEQNANYIGHYDPTTQHFTQYGLPSFKIPDPANSKNTLTLPSAPNDLVIDVHGNIWFTELNADAIGMLDSHTGMIRQYALDAQKSIQKLNPYGITFDAQGNVWFTESSNSQLGQLHPMTGQIDYFRTPDPTNPLMEIAADAEGHIWATAFNAGQLVMFDPSTKSYSVYHAPGASGSAGGLYGLTVTANDEVWLTISTENAIARFDVQAHRFVYYAIPSPNSLPLGIVAGPSDHSFWFTEAGTDKIGILQVR